VRRLPGAEGERQPETGTPPRFHHAFTTLRPGPTTLGLVMADWSIHNATWALFAWVLANQAGVPVPVTPSLMAAGALAGSGRLSVGEVLAAAVGAALCADALWYGLGRWRGARTLATLARLLRRPATSVDRIQEVYLAHRLGYLWSGRFLPELNALAAGLAGVTRLTPIQFVVHAAGSALVWAGTWVGTGFLLGTALAGSPDLPDLTVTVVTAAALAAVAASVVSIRRCVG
jgi:membrane protein DedA with SNARE-associated domain